MDRAYSEGQSKSTRWVGLSLPLALTVLAFLPRVFQLGRADIWGDEAFSINAGAQPLSTILSGGVDTHPPLYYLLLHFWVPIFGDSEFAIRLLSACLGTVVVPLTFLLAERLVDRRTAVLAALISVFSPFLVYYSQEARMYALVTCFSLASVYALTSMLRRPTRLAWVFYLVTTLLSMYSHYYAFFVLLCQVIVVGFWWHGQRGNRTTSTTVVSLVGAWILTVLAYIPWIVAQFSYLTGKGRSPGSSLDALAGVGIVWDSLVAFATGTTIPGIPGYVLAVLFLLVFLTGVFWMAKQRSLRLNSLLILLYGLVPLLLAFLVNPFMPLFNPRYVLLATPAYYIGLAAAIGALRGRWQAYAVVPMAVIIGASGYALYNYYFDPQYIRGGYGEIMQYVESKAGPNDVLVLGNVEQSALFDYYKPTKPKDSVYFPTAYLTADPRTGADISRLIDTHERAWLVMYGDPAVFDPNGDLKRWLGQHAFLTESRDFKGGAARGVQQTGSLGEWSKSAAGGLEHQLRIDHRAFLSRVFHSSGNGWAAVLSRSQLEVSCPYRDQVPCLYPSSRRQLKTGWADGQRTGGRHQADFRMETGRDD